MYSNWKLIKNDKFAKYQQIADIIANDIISGRLKYNSKLPSHRTLMKIFAVSRNTVLNALAELSKRNLIKIIPQSGILISSDDELQSNISLSPDWKHYASVGRYKEHNFDRQLQLSSLSRTDDKIINISAEGLGSEFNLLKPVIDIIGDKVLRKDLSNVNHFNKYGYMPLIEEIAKHLKTQGIDVSTSQILIMPSVRQSINLVCMAFLSFGANFVYAKPNVINMVTTVASMGANMIPIEMDDQGIKLDPLEKQFRSKNSILYLNPTSQNPTGMIIPTQRKLDILKITNKARVPIIEVDSLRDIWIDKPYPPSLRALDKTDSVIYLGSILRTLTLNLNISWVVAAPAVIEHLATIKAESDSYPSIILQLIATELFSSGSYYKYLEEIRPIIASKQIYTDKLLKKYLGDIASWIYDHSKFYFWVKFDDKVNTKKLYKSNISIEFSPGFFFDPTDTNHILICPVAVTDEELDTALNIINNSVRKLFFNQTGTTD